MRPMLQLTFNISYFSTGLRVVWFLSVFFFGWLVCWLGGWLAGCLAGCLVVWLFACLAGCLVGLCLWWWGSGVFGWFLAVWRVVVFLVGDCSQ